MLPDRLADVHAVLYLIVTEGYLASGEGAPVRADLCDEAIWLARQLRVLVPRDPELPEPRNVRSCSRLAREATGAHNSDIVEIATPSRAAPVTTRWGIKREPW